MSLAALMEREFPLAGGRGGKDYIALADKSMNAKSTGEVKVTA
jgi:hypothetical protein